MKIMFADATLQRGGAERVISLLSNYLVNLGHEVEIALYYDGPIVYDIDERVKIVNDEQFIGHANIFKHIKWRRSYIKKRKTRYSCFVFSSV